MAPDTAWRVAMIVPACLFLICAVSMKLLAWDTPTAKRFDVSVTGKTQKPSMWDYCEVLKDPRVVVMIFQYSACFGTASWIHLRGFLVHVTFTLPASLFANFLWYGQLRNLFGSAISVQLFLVPKTI